MSKRVSSLFFPSRLPVKAGSWLCLLGFWLLLGAWPASAADSQDLPPRASLQSQLEALAKRATLTVAEKAEQEDVEATLGLLDAIDKEKSTLKAQQQQLAAAPGQLREVSRQLERLHSEPEPATTAAEMAYLGFNQLNERLNNALGDLQSAQGDLSSVNSQLTFLQTLPERAQAAMNQAYQRSEAIRTQLGSLVSHQGEVSPSMRVRLNTELALLSLQIETRQLELDSNTTLQDLVFKQRDYLSARISRQEQLVQLLQQQLSSLRLTQTEKTVESTGLEGSATPETNHPLLEKELKTNQQLSHRLMTATEEVNNLVQENIKVKNWLERVTQTQRNLNEQISVLKGSLLLSRILYQQRQMLPDPKLALNLEERIADLRLAQFDLNQQRDQLYQGNEYRNSLLEKSKVQLSPDQLKTLSDLLDSRRQLLEQLNKQLGSQLNLAINLQLNQQQLERVNRSLQLTLQQQMFWVSSNKPLDLAWLTGLPMALLNQFQTGSISLNPSQWLERSPPLLLAIVPMLLMAGTMLWHRDAIRARLEKLGREVGQLRHDTHLHTPKALLLVAMRTIPGALFILVAGFSIMYSGLTEPEILGLLSLRLAMAYMMFGFLLRLLKPDGVAVAHFGREPRMVAHQRAALLRIWIVLVPLIIIATLGELDPSRLANAVLGQTIGILSLLSLSVLIFTSFRRSLDRRPATLLRLMTVTLASLVPLALVGLMVMGYYYTALKLSARLIDSFYLLTAWALVRATALRGLAVAARRLAYRRALAQRQQRSQEGVDTSEFVDDKPLGLEQISQQSLRLTNVALFLIFVGAFYWLWSDLVAVFAYLDSITLWHHAVGGEGSNLLEPVSLGDLLTAVLIALVAYLLTRNLPGLLEVLVLSRLQLSLGSSYAITTMLTYIISAVGLIASLSTIGMSWDKLQWLVAALSVGLGFGLQEIFANFVSGLIILFERPVRIGDIITLAEYSGTVSKIRIRATTITDFDRKEVIIPNKAFVTERLINWSLSDTITRVIVRVGVAYGSDLELTRQLLLQAARENRRVMKEPEPVVFFLAFGASTLDHELRFFVKELGDRNPALDETNRRIDQLFHEHNIEIAFNQVDVFIKNPQGEELKISANAVAAAAATAQAAPVPPGPEIQVPPVD